MSEAVETIDARLGMAWAERALKAEFRLHEIEQLARTIVDQSQGFSSAWEFDHGVDAEDLHRRLAESLETGR